MRKQAGDHIGHSMDSYMKVLAEIVRQISDPDFAQSLNKLQEVQRTRDDSNKRFSTNTDTWPDNFVKVYLNNYLAGHENGNCIEK